MSNIIKNLHVGSLIEINLETVKPQTFINAGEIVDHNYNNQSSIEKIKDRFGLIIKDLSYVGLNTTTYKDLVNQKWNPNEFNQNLSDSENDISTPKYYKNLNIITRIEFLYIPLSDQFHKELYQTFYETSLSDYVKKYFKSSLGYIPIIVIHKCFDVNPITSLVFDKIEEGTLIESIVKGIVRFNS